MSQGSQAFLAARDFLLAHRTDYDTAYAGFQWPQLEQFNWALDYFDSMAAGNNSPALWIVEEDGSESRVSFADMSKRSSQVANWLKGLGVKRGERVLLMLGNEVALWEIMLACMKLGAVVIPCSSLLTTEDLRDRLDRGEVAHVIAARGQADKFDVFEKQFTRICVGEGKVGWHSYADSLNASAAFTPDAATLATDPLLLYFTSGTTSKPKLVMHSHQSYPVGHLSTLYWIGLQPGDVHLNISSPGWAKHAWSCFFAPWNAGACVFMFNQARFNAKALLEQLARCKVTSLCAPPTVWRMLIQEDLAAVRSQLALRELVGAGEPLNPEVIERVQKGWGLTIRDGYGQTETTAQIGNPPGQVMKSGSMGRPLPGYRVSLVDHDGKPADEGEIGLVLDPRPMGLMQGYLGDTTKNEQVMRHGVYRTGDVAQRDSDGYITYVGRADDVFKSSDYRISPFELESVAIEHPAVAEAAIIPSPDPVRLAVPKVVVALRQGYTASPELARSILEFLRDKLAPYKRVRRLEFAELPKTISGKIRRVELRATENRKRLAGEKSEFEFDEGDFQ